MMARQTMEVCFEKPAGFKYRAGQFVHVWLDVDSAQRKENVRSMSLASAPCENHLATCMRMTGSAWKQKMTSLALGDTIEISEARGILQLTLQPEDVSKTAVMIAGGIGVVPFRSMVKQEMYDKTGREMVLFYFSRTKEDAAYFDELKGYQNDRFRMVPSFTDPATPADETYERGHLTRDMLCKYITDTIHAIFYVVGTATMVDGVCRTLIESGISEEQIRRELFTGYGRMDSLGKQK